MIDLHLAPDHARVDLGGELDISTQRELAATFAAALELRDDVRVNLGAVTFVDSSAVGQLLRLQRTAVERGGRFRVIALHENVLATLRLVGLDRLLGVVEE